MRGRLGLPRIVAVTLTLLVLFVGVDAFVAPPAHPVHTGGGTPASAAAYGSTDDLWWTASDPTESLSQVRCFEWHTDGRPPCSAGLIAARFPGLKQTEHTLYVVWTGCVD